MPEIVGKLVFEIAVPDARSACTVAEGVARLDHELGYDAVEDHPVVVPAARVSDKVFDSFGSLLREQAHVHVPQRRVDRRGRLEGRGARGRGRRGGGDRLFFTRRALIEDISIARFRDTVPIV